MPRWIPCGENFIVGDVVRWKEAIWKPRTRAKGRPKVIGERLIVAEVTAIAGDGMAILLIKRCDAKAAEVWLKPLPKLEAGTTVKRRRSTITKGGAARYIWGGSDGESVRGQLTSKFRKAVEE